MFTSVNSDKCDLDAAPVAKMNLGFLFGATGVAECLEIKYFMVLAVCSRSMVVNRRPPVSMPKDQSG